MHIVIPTILRHSGGSRKLEGEGAVHHAHHGSTFSPFWIPAFAGMTWRHLSEGEFKGGQRSETQGHSYASLPSIPTWTSSEREGEHHGNHSSNLTNSLAWLTI